MTSNLQEFLSVALLVTAATSFVCMFRYAIIVFERRGQEEIRRRQPEWDALHAKYARQRIAKQNEQAK